VHDPLGRRIAKKVNGTITEKYLWQGMTRLLTVYDGSDNLLMRFEYAYGRMPVAMTKGGATYYLTYDQVGSLRVVADAVGTVLKRIDYDSFGNIISDSNPSFAVPFGFAGGLHDRDTGLVRFGYRDYDPDTGRWTAKDPLLFLGGNVNLYEYVLNDPVDLLDPYGAFGLPGAAVGAAVGGFFGGLGAFLGSIANPCLTKAQIVQNTIAGALGGAIVGLIAGGIGGGPALGALTGAFGGAAASALGGSSALGVLGGALGGSLGGFAGGVIGGLEGVLTGGVLGGSLGLGFNLMGDVLAQAL
jgi:RHS repeat-associated protein